MNTRTRIAFFLICFGVVVCMLVCCAETDTGSQMPEKAAGSDVTVGRLLLDMLDAYNTKAEDGAERIDAEVAALGDETAAAVAECWKMVYMDPGYRLYVYGTDEPSELPVSGRHAFVVLGYELSDGEMTAELKGRCDAAAIAAAAFPDSIIVCSGGATGKNNPENHTEAGLMKQYMVEQHGIAADRIFIDESAMNTVDNAVNTLEILEAQQIEIMTLVTSAYHQPRAQVLYTAVAARYKQERGYSVQSVGNFCYEIEPQGAFAAMDALVTVAQLAGIIQLSEDDAKLVSDVTTAAMHPPFSQWEDQSPTVESVTAYVQLITDPESEAFVPEEERIAVFDFDGTLYGELFPTYFDVCLFLHRALHDETYTPNEDVYAYAAEYEAALAQGLPEPEAPRSTAQMTAECFSGMTVEEYRAYIREFMKMPASGFSGMTYAKGFYKPMLQLIEYLEKNGFTVFISSGSERTLVRELINGVIDIPPYRVIGSTFSLAATGQNDAAGRSYTYAADDDVLIGGDLAVKNQKTNKVFSIVDEIGQIPVLVFGNSSGDLAMAQYALQHGGKAYMLLADDAEREYGDAEKAAAFAEECRALGFETVSMRDEFKTIYGRGVNKTAEQTKDGAPEELVPAA